MLLCIQLLKTHLALALAGSVANNVLGGQARPLRNLLFRLMDMNTPVSIQGVRVDDKLSLVNILCMTTTALSVQLC